MKVLTNIIGNKTKKLLKKQVRLKIQPHVWRICRQNIGKLIEEHIWSLEDQSDEQLRQHIQNLLDQIPDRVFHQIQMWNNNEFTDREMFAMRNSKWFYWFYLLRRQVDSMLQRRYDSRNADVPQWRNRYWS